VKNGKEKTGHIASKVTQKKEKKKYNHKNSKRADHPPVSKTRGAVNPQGPQ